MNLLLWGGFIVFILLMLALDLGVLNRKAHVISTKSALGWTACWVALAVAFNVVVYYFYEHHYFALGTMPGHELSGKDAVLQFFTGYLIEESLSLDNVLVIALIFSYFKIPLMYQHRVLFWGIIGVLVMRGAMIAAGTALIHKFEWITYVFGALLIITAVKLLVSRNESVDPERNPLVRLARRLYPFSPTLDGEKFFTRLPDGRQAMTPLFLVLLVVESTDVLFAVDSIPAVFAVTYDPFIVFTSNVFAILGLRSLYFALAGVMEKFQYLTISLVFVLAFVGMKLILAHHFPIPTAASLGVIGGLILVGILASIYRRPRT